MGPCDYNDDRNMISDGPLSALFTFYGLIAIVQKRKFLHALKMHLKEKKKRLVLLFVYSVVFSVLSVCSALDDAIDSNQVMRDGDTKVSAGGVFQMGFFSPPNVITRYFGIWYMNISPRTVVWVANRKLPLSDAGGALYLTRRGVLILLDSRSNAVWSSKTAIGTRQDPVAQLLDSGNLVVRERYDNNSDNYQWQSFGYPCDTWLPGMKLGTDFSTGIEKYLSSWLSPKDPAPGNFSFRIDTRGYPQLVSKEGSEIVYRLGSWNGLTLSGTLNLMPSSSFSLEFETNKEEVYLEYGVASDSALTRLSISSGGDVQELAWDDRAHRWGIVPTIQPDRCDRYAICGVYGICSINNSRPLPLCSCLEGFIPNSLSDWSSSHWSRGCKPKTLVGCGKDEFLKISRVKLPDTSNSSWFNNSKSLDDCKMKCLDNCSCTAYANLDVRGTGCLLWYGELIDMRALPFLEQGQDIYVLVRSADSKSDKQGGIIAGSVVAATIVLLLAGLCFALYKKSIRKSDISSKERLELPMLDLTTIARATDNFSSSNKLGEGGFGPVYMGTLEDGQEIAVKRLSNSSVQGLDEFKTEILLIAKLQHRNLVKLLGFCINEDEKMLIYEYMSNKSLDTFIFDKTKSKLLDWSKRFHIIGGVARGLLYLHQDSRLRIIHRDLKSSNILLDYALNAKISDFGLARMFGAEQTQASTKRVVGTYGYMAPEYVVDGVFSMKSDVFSFGVLAIEILNGRRNWGFQHPDHEFNLLGHAWMLWTNGTPLHLLDECLVDGCNPHQVTRCINAALLCVQQRPEDRPTMSQVVLMLESRNSLPEPKRPGFFTRRNPPEAHCSSSYDASYLGSSNTITGSTLDAR